MTKQARWKAKMKAAKLCISCGRSLEGVSTQHCPRHLKYHREKERVRKGLRRGIVA